MEEELYLQDIPGAEQWQRVDRITDGWSTDQKFRVETKSGLKYLLRLSEQTDLEKAQEHYTAFRKLATKELPIPILLDAGYGNHGRHTYRLFTWIEGKLMRNEIQDLPITRQYELGWQAGQALRVIHQVSPERTPNHWAGYYKEKIDRKIASFKNGHFTFAKADKMLDCIKDHRELLEGRPTTFQHGDFHIGNMLLTPTGGLSIIDFNRLDFGDPWEEFNRINWTAQLSPNFAKAQINGYFEDEIPVDFFPLLGLYIATNQIGAFAWAAAYGAAEVKTHHKQTLEILDWYDDFQKTRPKWYD